MSDVDIKSFPSLFKPVVTHGSADWGRACSWLAPRRWWGLKDAETEPGVGDGAMRSPSSASGGMCHRTYHAPPCCTGETERHSGWGRARSCLAPRRWWELKDAAETEPRSGGDRATRMGARLHRRVKGIHVQVHHHTCKVPLVPEPQRFPGDWG